MNKKYSLALASAGAGLYFFQKEDLFMEDLEKKIIQAKHRLEEAEARDSVKERKARDKAADST